MSNHDDDRRPAPAPWRIVMLGGLRAEHQDRVVTRFGWKKVGSLVAYLALRMDRACTRDRLIDLLWPDADLDAGRQNLSQALSSLRRLLEPDRRLREGALVADRDTVSLNGGLVSTDVREFHHALESAGMAGEDPEPWLRRAVQLYQGELLPGFDEEWIYGERERLADRYVTALERLTAVLEERRTLDEALSFALLAAQTEPLRETAHQLVIRLYAATGQPARAIQQFRDLQRILRDELDIDPSPESTSLMLRVASPAEPQPVITGHSTRLMLPTTGWHREPPDAEDPAPADNLPAPVSTFIGRDREIEQIVRHLGRRTQNGAVAIGGLSALANERRPVCRLVTLTGPGGCGKTRLAIEAANVLRGQFPDGIWLVELAPLTDPGAIAEAVLSAIGIRAVQPDASPSEQLARVLQNRSPLIVLDNCEHLVEACANLAHCLLTRCPGVRVLATGREALGIPGELVYPVPALPVPPDMDALPLKPEVAGAIAAYDSVKLFAERAGLVRQGFTIDSLTALPIARICRELDGIPLAIELAAARTRSLSVDELADRLKDRALLLENGSRVASPRHQTLGSVIRWSYDLLPEPERAFLSILSVFRGGWTLATAERFTEGGWWLGDTVTTSVRNNSRGNRQGEEQPALRKHMLNADSLLASLVDKSLVVFDDLWAAKSMERSSPDGCGADGGSHASTTSAGVDSGPAGRYRLLETIRQFAGLQLQASSLEQIAKEKHFDCYLALADVCEAKPSHEGRSAWFDRMEMERDNLHAALESSGAWADQRGLKLAVALGPLWVEHGHGREGRAQLASVLERPGSATPSVARSLALTFAGMVGMAHNNPAAERALYEEALAIARSEGHVPALAQALNCLGRRLLTDKDNKGARTALDECVKLCEATSETDGLIHALTMLGWEAASRKDRTTAQSLWERSLSISRATGSRAGEAWNLRCLAGVLLRADGDLTGACARAREAVAVSSRFGDHSGAMEGLWLLADLLARLGDRDGARSALEEALLRARAAGDIDGIDRSQSSLAATPDC